MRRFLTRDGDQYGIRITCRASKVNPFKWAVTVGMVDMWTGEAARGKTPGQYEALPEAEAIALYRAKIRNYRDAGYRITRETVLR